MSWDFLSRLLARKDLLRQVDRRGKRRPIVPRLERLEERFVFSTGVIEYTIPTAFSQPNRIVAGPPADDDLWFTEYSGDKIGKITTSGAITEYTVPTANAGPYDIALGSGNTLWFTEQTGNKVAKITTSGTITEYSVPTASAYPEDVAIDGDGDVWFDESFVSKIGKLDPNTGTITEYALPSGYQTPIGLAPGSDGRLWFTDQESSSPFSYAVAAVTTSGVISEYVSSSLPSGAADEAVGPDGNVWFASETSSVGYLTTAGQAVVFSGGGSGATLGMAASPGPPGALWYTQGGGIYTATTAGASATVLSSSAGYSPWGITVGPEGHLWFTDQTNDSIGTLDWALSGGAVQDDPIQGLQTPIPGQPGSTFAPAAAFLQVQVPLLYTQGGTNCSCGVSALTYSSATVNVHPVVQVTFSSGPGDPVPTTLQARLIWAGAAGSWITISTSGLSSGAAYNFALQDPNAVTSTNLYSWEVDVEATLTGSLVIDRDLEGYLPVVVNTSSPVGAGWSIGKADYLVPTSGSGVPAGELYVYGTGGARFFASTGTGTYQSPPSDAGTLTSVTVGVTTTYTYATPTHLTYTFDTNGRLLSMVAPDGETNTFTYSGGLLTGITMYDGGLTTFQYSGGLLTEVDEPMGAVLLSHTGSDLTGVTMPNGGLRTFTYDGSGHHLLTADFRLPLAASYAYDATYGALTTITLAGGQTITIDPAWLTELRGVKALSGSNPADTVVNGLSQTATYVLDLLGRWLTEQFADGSLWVRTLDFAGNPTSVTDANGNTTSYSYLYGPSGLGDLTQVTYPDGSTRQFQYGSTFNEPTAAVDQNGNRTTMSYDSVGDLLTVTDALNHTTTYAYYQTGGTPNGEVMSVTDPNGNVVSYAYDSAQRVIEEIDGYGTALASTATMIYDAAGDLLSETTGQSTTAAYAHPSTTSYAYDGMGRVTEEIDGYGTAQQRETYYAYDGAGDLLSVTDPNGNVTSYAYNAAGQTTEEIDGYGTAVASTATMIYDAAGDLLSETTGQSTTSAYAHPSTTSFAYDGMGRVTEEIQGYGTAVASTATTVYDAAGNVLSVTDPNGNTTSYAYDSLNRVVKEIDGYGTAVASTATMIYDAAGNLLSDTTGQSTTVAYAHPSTTSYAYDALNRVVEEINGYGTAVASTATMIYDKAGNLLSETTGQSTTSAYAHASTTSYAYDALNRRTAEIDGYGTAAQRTMTTVYDAQGEVAASIDANGAATTYTYDALGRPVSVKDPLGDLSTTVYDAVGDAVNTIDANGDKTTFVYDALNRRVETIDPDGGVTTVAYDAAGDQVSLTDPDGNKTTMAYDALGRMTGQTDPLNHTTTYAYDAGGRLTSTTDPLGRVRNLSYDALNRETGETWVVSSVTTNVQTFTYDASGDQLTAADYSGAYTMAYDALGRMTSEQEPFGLALTFSYDASSDRVLMLDSFSGVTTSSYNALGELTERQFGGSGQTALHVSLTWTPDGQLATLSRYDDQSGSTLVGTSSYIYDAADQLTGLTDQTGGGTVLASFAYSYDAAGWLTQQTVDGAATTYSYDPTGQLLQAGAATYGYDAAGNRDMTGYQVGTGDQVTNDGTWTYTYDAAGELTEKSKGPSSETWTYGYDLDGQMAWAQDRATPGGTLLTAATYTYDVRGNLLEEDVWTQASGTVTVSRYGYDGSDAWVDLNGSDQLTMRRLYLDGPDQPFVRIDSGGTAAWYLTDRQGSVRDIASFAGTTVIDHLVYDAYGNVTSESSPSNGDAYAYDGYRRDGATGYDLSGARWYDPATGGWTTRDPSGFAGGDYNTYRYVHNGPTDGFDPTGLWNWNAAWTGAAWGLLGGPLTSAGGFVIAGISQGDGPTDYPKAALQGLGVACAPAAGYIVWEYALAPAGAGLWAWLTTHPDVVESGGLNLQYNFVQEFQGMSNSDIVHSWAEGQKDLLNEWMGSGPQGAIDAFGTDPPAELSVKTLEGYYEIARRMIDADNDPVGTQELRILLIQNQLRRIGE